MRVLVTGDKGYIGSVLVPLLLQKKYDVIGLDTEFFTVGLKTAKKKYHSLKKDIRHVTEKDLEGIDAVIHLAALSNDPLGQINPGLTTEINLKASKRLAQLAKKAGVKRFLFSSSCSIYGIAKDGIVDESSPVSPQTAYAESKIKMEEVLKKLADKDFCVGLLRNSTVYGYSPKFRNDLVVNNFVTCAIGLGKIKIMSDGSPWRPLIDVRDLSNVFISFLEADEKKINGKTVNIGFNTNNFQVKQLVSAVKEALPDCEIEFTGEHGSDTRSYQVNFDLFSALFPETKQQWNLNKSIKDLIEKLRKNNYSKEDFESGKFTRLVVIKELLEKQIINNDLFFITNN